MRDKTGADPNKQRCSPTDVTQFSATFGLVEHKACSATRAFSGQVHHGPSEPFCSDPCPLEPVLSAHPAPSVHSQPVRTVPAGAHDSLSDQSSDVGDEGRCFEQPKQDAVWVERPPFFGLMGVSHDYSG